MLRVLLGEYLRQRAHHDPWVVKRLSGHSLASAQRAGIVADEKRPVAFLPHRGQYFLRDKKRPPARDMLRRIEHLHRNVFEQFLVRRKITALEVTRVIDQGLRIASFATDRGERRGDRVLRNQVHLDDHALAALLADGLLQYCRIGLLAGCQYDEEALLRELLGDSAPDAPSHADGQSTVVDSPAVSQQGIAPVRLPLGGRADHDGDLLALRVRFAHWRTSCLFVAFGRSRTRYAVRFRISRMSVAPVPSPPRAERLSHDESLVILAEPRKLLGEHGHALAP